MLGPGHKLTIRELARALRERDLIYWFPRTLVAAALALSIEWKIDYDCVYDELVDATETGRLQADWKRRHDVDLDREQDLDI